jgi:hypothetical protein
VKAYQAEDRPVVSGFTGVARSKNNENLTQS